MSRFLLDTNIISSWIRDPHGLAGQRVRLVGRQSVCTSIIVVAELRYGAAKKRSLRIHRKIDEILSYVETLAFESPADIAYGDIRAELAQAGTLIGPNDLLIAAQARALGLTVVTDNEREFGRVPGLAVENWLN